MTDIDRLFDDLAYPGKRKPALRDQPQPAIKIVEWDDKPLFYKVGGVDTEFFAVRHLAQAVNRLPRTIRHWETRGIIPPATFRTPHPHKGSSVKGTYGDRLYSREQVEAVAAAAKACGVLDGKAPNAQFTKMITQQWLRLQNRTK